MANDNRRNAGKGSSGKYRSSKPNSKGQRGTGRGKPYPPKKARSDAADRAEPAKRRRDLKGAAVDLPNWVIEALTRVTPKDRVAPALEELGEASAAM